MRQFKFLMKYIGRHKWQYLGGVITLFVVDYMNLLIPQMTGEVTDGLTGRTLDFDGIIAIIIKILIVGAILAIGRFLWRYFIFGAAREIQYEGVYSSAASSPAAPAR